MATDFFAVGFSVRFHDSALVSMSLRIDGWMDEWLDGWMEGTVYLNTVFYQIKIYSNIKIRLHKICTQYKLRIYY